MNVEISIRVIRQFIIDDPQLIAADGECSRERTVQRLEGDFHESIIRRKVTVLQWESTVVDLNLPSTIELEITDTQPGVAGDRANPGKKPAVVETGATVQVPLFVETGERIIVNGETRDYMGRAEK